MRQIRQRRLRNPHPTAVAAAPASRDGDGGSLGGRIRIHPLLSYTGELAAAVALDDSETRPHDHGKGNPGTAGPPTDAAARTTKVLFVRSLTMFSLLNTNFLKRSAYCSMTLLLQMHPRLSCPHASDMYQESDGRGMLDPFRAGPSLFSRLAMAHGCGGPPRPRARSTPRVDENSSTCTHQPMDWATEMAKDAAAALLSLRVFRRRRRRIRTQPRWLLHQHHKTATEGP